MSFVMTPMSAAAMGAAPVAKAGVASGVLNTFRQVGVALGIAIMGAIVTDRASGAARRREPAQAFVDGLTFGMKVERGDLPSLPRSPRRCSSAATATPRRTSAAGRVEVAA